MMNNKIITFESELNKYFQSIIDSFQSKKTPVLDDDLNRLLHQEESILGFDLSNAKIMISSWNEFLDQLFRGVVPESLLNNLNNHVTFIKKLSGKTRDVHLRYFKTICERLFDFIIREKLTLTTNYEIEDEYRSFELDLCLYDREFDLINLVLFILSRDYSEINETTFTHIEGVLLGVQQKTEENIHYHLTQLKAIQETLLTILQMDRKDQKNQLVRKLQKEFELINNFYFIIRKITEYKLYEIGNPEDFEFKASYDYPFLDVLKTVSKWYQQQDTKYIQNAQQITSYIHAKKPFRAEDKEFLSCLNDLLDITMAIELTGKETESENKSKLAKEDILSKVNGCLEFFLNLFVDPGMTLIYKRKLFTSIAVIVHAWLKYQVIPLEKSRGIMSDFIQLDRHLKKQSLKKMGSFIKISYHLTPRILLGEFEKGIGTHLLYALEDFSDWSEGKEIREILGNSAVRSEARFSAMENLYKVSHEIIDYKEEDDDKSEDAVDLATIKKGMVKTYFSKIIGDNFILLPQLFQSLYSALIIHALNLAYDSGKLSQRDRDEILSRLYELNSSKYKQIEFVLLNYAISQLFSENYEKEFSTVVTLLHLYIPVARL